MYCSAPAAFRLAMKVLRQSALKGICSTNTARDAGAFQARRTSGDAERRKAEAPLRMYAPSPDAGREEGVYMHGTRVAHTRRRTAHKAASRSGNLGDRPLSGG